VAQAVADPSVQVHQPADPARFVSAALAVRAELDHGSGVVEESASALFARFAFTPSSVAEQRFIQDALAAAGVTVSPTDETGRSLRLARVVEQTWASPEAASEGAPAHVLTESTTTEFLPPKAPAGRPRSADNAMASEVSGGRSGEFATPAMTHASHTSSSSVALTPAGWYSNPEGPGHRYWDGAAWTDSYTHPPAASRTHAAVEPATAAESGTPGLVVAGYVLAVLIPIVGFILGIVAVTRPDKRTSKHGVWIIVVSVIAFVLWIAILAAASAGAGAGSGGGSYY
jgi:hypothetical protein